MTASQRAALIGLMRAILNCDCAAPEMRERAQALEAMLDPLASLKRQFGWI